MEMPTPFNHLVIDGVDGLVQNTLSPGGQGDNEAAEYVDYFAHQLEFEFC